MTLLDALNEVVADGGVMISCIGKRYSAEALASTWRGEHYASYSGYGMTREECEGAWVVV